MTGLWEFLSQDVTIMGGPHSPLLSWLGSLGLLLFFVWHAIKLKREASRVREAFERICPVLCDLLQARGDVDRERFLPHSKRPKNTQGDPNPGLNRRVDCDDLQTLDEKMGKEPMFGGPWEQYRMTLILERVPWFLEPRIFSTRRAEEIFTQEAILANRVNLPFYNQFPSLVTGMGLLFTFIALFIGLGKLHAEGSEILGIQGLINGLAGKFLTSIVGLIVANLFTFIEKPTVSRLMRAHHMFLEHMDRLFPRKTMEQMLEQLTSAHGKKQEDRWSTGLQPQEPGGRAGLNSLVGPIANLSSVIQSLRTMQEHEHADTRRTMSELPHVIKDELQAPIRELTDAIHGLTNMLKKAPWHQGMEEPTMGLHAPLWKDSPDRHPSSGAKHSKKAKAWPRWPRLSKLRKAG